MAATTKRSNRPRHPTEPPLSTEYGVPGVGVYSTQNAKTWARPDPQLIPDLLMGRWTTRPVFSQVPPWIGS